MTFVWIYIVLGLATVWLCVEQGHKEAKTEGLTLRQYHKKIIEEKFQGDPNGRKIMGNIWLIIFVIFLLWWVMLALEVRMFFKK